MEWIEAKNKPKPNSENSFSIDGWKFDKADIIPLEQRDSSELKSLIEKTEKLIKDRENYLSQFPDALHCYLINNELYVHKRGPGIHLSTEIIKGSEVYTNEQIEKISDYLRMLRHDQAWRNVLIIALIRRDRGRFYFGYLMEERKKSKKKLYEKDYELFVKLKKENPNIMNNEEIIYMMELLYANDKKRSFEAIRKSVYKGQRKSFNK
jgi:hypothetical protein